MKFFVRIKPGARQDRVERLDETHFRVSVKAPALDGRANAALTEVLGEFLGVPKSRLEVVSGLQSKNKTVLLS